MTVRLVGGAMVLERFRPGDVAVLTAHGADQPMQRFNPGPPDGDWRAWVDRRNDWSTGDHASWAIRDLRGRLLGSVSLHRFEPADATAEIGYFVLPPHRGKGVATAAVRLASEYAFDAVGLHRLSLFHAVANAASCVVAERSGFRLEGVTRSSRVYGDGHRHDEHLHARLITDPATS